MPPAPFPPGSGQDGKLSWRRAGTRRAVSTTSKRELDVAVSRAHVCRLSPLSGLRSVLFYTREER